jgi:hypothetical protein
MQVFTLLWESVSGHNCLDQLGLYDAHARLIVDLGLDERNEILEILLADDRELIGPFGTGVVQGREIPGMRIDFP